MTDHDDPTDPTPVDELDDDSDPVLEAAGARLRAASRGTSATAVEAAVLRRRARRLGILAAASILAVVVLGGVLVLRDEGAGDVELASPRPGAPTAREVERILADLDDQPVDPTQVDLVSTVSTFADCDALVDDLRRVGAEHVGSRGFGGFGGVFEEVGMAVSYRDEASATDDSAALAPYGPEALTPAGVPSDGDTIGTNVQVEGVDELDFVKAEGSLIYDLVGNESLRITDATTGEVLSTLDLTPRRAQEIGGEGQVDHLLVADGRVVVFGSQVEVSAPVEGDPSATQASVRFMTVTFVDATDPAAPAITDRVRVEGGLVSARLVDGEIRLVTTSNMADLGFVMPTSPTSVEKALDRNRRSVASSTAADWIPDWQRDGEDPEALVPCPQVYVPDTFAGVAMTSMVTFPLGTGRFAPQATSIVAPGTTLYAGLEKVAISSEVWVDPIDREGLEFDDWETAIHEFSFADEAPTYVGSGIVDGSTVGQFAFGEVGDSLAVVTTQGTPWEQDPDVAIDLTLLTADDDGHLDVTAQVEDLSDGQGAVQAVRFVEGRVLISTGTFGQQVLVIDVSDPASPRRAGAVTIPGAVGYFHPLPEGRALMVGSRIDEVGEGDRRISRQWVQASMLDVSDADAPQVVDTWERPWVGDEVGSDHHAFTYWPSRQLAMWGLEVREPDVERGNEAAVIGTEDGVTEVAVPVASKPDEVPAPCPTVEVTNPEARRMLGPDDVVLACDPGTPPVDWPRYQCGPIGEGTLARYGPEDRPAGSYQLCTPAPQPRVRRVLVVDGTPMLLTDQTLERLDPETFASADVLYHPSNTW